MSGEDFITIPQAVAILREELHYPVERAEHFVKTFDRNNDGRLSRQEFQVFRTKVNETKANIVPMFKEYDQDGNGFITLEEASAILQKEPFNFPSTKVVALLRTFDKDGNGKLDIAEFAGFYADAKATHEDIATRFDMLDKDGNGYLSPDEVRSVIMDTMGFDVHMADCMIEMFDQNKDGKLDKTEFISLWSSMFGGPKCN